jgi:chromosomal replication initiator protein
VGGNWESAGAVAEARELNTWDLIKAKLAERIAPQEFQNWVMRTALESLDQGSLRVQVPDQVTKDFIEQEYTEQIRSTIRELNLPVETVVYLPHLESRVVAADTSSASSSLEPAFASAAGQLNTRFRFDNFVVGSCNQFAHAAARAVADSPSRSYNPLFIYGGVGMGKTHLMHAIGRELLDKYPSIRVVYTSSERFMNEMILCLRTNRMPSFQRHYRSADVLLVDDIQILAGKERMQEEFFHTFNELYDHQKQIVLSSDSAPKSTAGLVERLRSRFEWGLMVDVQPPDLEK